MRNRFRRNRAPTADTAPDNMVYLRDSITDLVTTTLDRFSTQAVKTLYEAVGDIDSYYDFCFSRYDKAMEATYKIPDRESEMLLGSDRKTEYVKLLIITPERVINVGNSNGYHGKNYYLPYETKLSGVPPDVTVTLQLALSRTRFGRGLGGRHTLRDIPIILSPGMDNYELLMQSAKSLVHIRNKLHLYRPITSYILGTVGTTGKLRTVWPQVLPFLPAAAKQAMTGRTRTTWPVSLVRSMSLTGWTQETLSKTLANIAANVVHASMLPDIEMGAVQAQFQPRIMGHSYGSVPHGDHPPPHAKPPGYPNYKSTL